MVRKAGIFPAFFLVDSLFFPSYNFFVSVTRETREKNMGTCSRYSFFALIATAGSIFTWGYCHGQEQASYCTPSLVLPQTVHLVEAAACFSPDYAEALSSDPAALERYLSRFPETEIVHSYHYWVYLRTQRFLPALLALIVTVNGARSLEPALMFRDDMTFIVVNGIKQIPPDVNLFGRGGEVSSLDLSHRFFFILDQVVTLYAEKNEEWRRDAWLLYRSFSLFFSSIGTIPETNDPYTDELLKRFYRLWKEGLLLSYLDFFFFFTGGDGSYLPSVFQYTAHLAKMVPLPKFEDKNREKERLTSISRLIAQFTVERLSEVPILEFIETDDIRAWYRTSFMGRDSSDAPHCKIFDVRNEMFLPFKDDLFRPLMENRALSLMEGCDPRHGVPFVMAGTKVYLSASDRWLSDVAIAYAIIMHGTFSYREASNLLSGALLSALGHYLKVKEKNQRPFGEMLLYAYHTRRLASLRDALFLYRKYKEDPDYTTKNLTDAVRFASTFFFGNHEQEP